MDKETEQSLLGGDPDLQQIFDESLLAKAVIGLDGRILKANRAACALLGYSEAELLTKTFGDVSYPEDIPPTLAALQSLADSIDWHCLLGLCFCAVDLGGPAPPLECHCRDGWGGAAPGEYVRSVGKDGGRPNA
jgi:hypothetical protein